MIGRKLNRDKFAARGTRRERKAQEATTIIAVNERLLKQLEKME